MSKVDVNVQVDCVQILLLYILETHYNGDQSRMDFRAHQLEYCRPWYWNVYTHISVLTQRNKSIVFDARFLYSMQRYQHTAHSLTLLSHCNSANKEH